MELDFPELELSRLIQQPGWGVSLSNESLIIDVPSKSDALSLLDALADSLALAAANLKRISALIRYPYAPKPYKIPITVGTLQMITNDDTTLILDPSNPLIEVYCLSLSPVLYPELGWLLEHPEQAGGIVRAKDNQQVAMSYANARKDSDFTAGAGVKKAVKWKRSDYWHPQDLVDFEREWQQKLEPNNPDSWMEFKWRSFDPDLGISSPDGWIEFTNYYKLLVDDHGNTYHVSQNLGMRDISQPVGV
jgi:hypothetical protein